MNWMRVFSKTFAYENRRALLAAAGIALAANAALAVLATYPLHRLAVAAENEDRDMHRETENARLKLERLATFEGQVAVNRKNLETFFDSVLSTKNERMTFFLRELRRMAQASQISYTDVVYQRASVREVEGVIRFGTQLPVEGTYDSVRRFISAIENNRALFLIINHVSLRSQTVTRFDIIKLDVDVTTYFLDSELPADDSPEAESKGAEGAAAPAGEKSPPGTTPAGEAAPVSGDVPPVPAQRVGGTP